jgi:hypothetical protein
MQGYVVTSNFEYEMDKNGKFYGWGIARYSTPEAFFGKKFTSHVYDRSPEESRKRIIRHLKKILPEAGNHGRKAGMNPVHGLLQGFRRNGAAHNCAEPEIIGMVGSDQGQKQNGCIVHGKFAEIILCHRTPQNMGIV